LLRKANPLPENSHVPDGAQKAGVHAKLYKGIL